MATREIKLTDVLPGDVIEVHGFRQYGRLINVSRVQVDQARHFSLGLLPYVRIWAICGLKLSPEKRRERVVLEGFGAADGLRLFLISRSEQMLNLADPRVVPPGFVEINKE